MDKTTARIEKDLITKRFETLVKMKPEIRLQLKRIEDKVYELWKLDSVSLGQIRLDCFDACAHSKLTLDQLEDIIMKEGQNMTKYRFDKALKKIVRKANKVNRKVSFNDIRKLVYGKIS